MLKNILMTVPFAAACAFAGTADAQTYSFKLTGSYVAQWTLDARPKPAVSFDGLGFIVNDVRGTFDGIAGSLADIDFYTSAEGGGLEIDDPARGDLPLLITNGLQLYGGSEAAPVFLLGSYALTQYNGSGRYNLSIETAAPVPELATWAMMIAGLGVVGATMRRRGCRSVHVSYRAI